MFGFLDDIVQVAASVSTLGLVDEMNVKKLLETGYTVYEISEMTGLALSLVETVTKD